MAAVADWDHYNDFCFRWHLKHTHCQARHVQTSDATPEKITDALRPLMRRPDIQLIILFGFTARGDTHRGSDIDVAILAVEARVAQQQAIGNFLAARGLT